MLGRRRRKEATAPSILPGEPATDEDTSTDLPVPVRATISACVPDATMAPELTAPEATTPEATTSIVDGDTGLPDRRYFELALDHRVAAARRHLWPVALVLMEVPPEPRDAADDLGALPAEADGLDRLLLAVDHPMVELARVVRETLREADTACRVGERTIALLLEDTAEAGGVGTAERLQVAMALRGVDVRNVVTGVAAYPSHGLRGDAVLAAAEDALEMARATLPGRHLGPVAVAVPEG